MANRKELFRIDSLSLYEDSPSVKRKQSKLLQPVNQELLKKFCLQSPEENTPFPSIEYSKSHEMVSNNKQQQIFEKYSKSQNLIQKKQKNFFENKVKKKAKQLQLQSEATLTTKKQQKKIDQKMLMKQLIHIKSKLQALLEKKQFIGNTRMNKAESCILEQIKSLEKQLKKINKIIQKHQLKENYRLPNTQTYEVFQIQLDSPHKAQSHTSNTSIQQGFNHQRKKLIPQYLNVIVFSLFVLILSLLYVIISRIFRF